MKKELSFVGFVKGSLTLFLVGIILTFLIVLLVDFVFPGKAYPAGATKIIDDQGVARGVRVWSSDFLGVIPSDQVTRSFDFYLSQSSNGDMTLASIPVVGSYTAVLSAGHSIIANDLISFVDIISEGHNYYAGKVLSIDTNTLTLDTPIPYGFDPVKTYLYERQNSLVIDGSTTTQIFALTNPYPDAADITRFVFHIRDASDMDDHLFGGMPALTRGIVLRKKISETEYENFWNVKTNGELGSLGYKVYEPKAPAGEYGLSITIDYAGMENHGVAIRLEPYQSIEILVQDDLTDLTYFKVIAQGHFTTEE